MSELLPAPAGLQWTDFQAHVLAAERATPAEQLRVCLYYRPGAGKTLTSLALVAQAGVQHVLVVCPPATYDTWESQARTLGLDITCVSHAKFRMKTFKVSRDQAVIVDELHMLGGHTGKGWMKLDRMAAGLKAPLVIGSATPQYNDAERVYCIQHVMDPLSCRGGFIAFLYQHCMTEPDPFSMTPKVTGFLRFKDSTEYLNSLQHVYYVPDNVDYDIIKDLVVTAAMPKGFDEFGYDVRTHRVIASGIEERHKRITNGLVNLDGSINHIAIGHVIILLTNATTPVLIYCNHSTIAEALEKDLAEMLPLRKIGLVTGDTPMKKKQGRIQAFRDGVLDVLIGTATLGTGTDGLDKVCDTLIIFDDTDDPSARKQLIGRIMPRGLSVDASKKQVFRLVLQTSPTP